MHQNRKPYDEIFAVLSVDHKGNEGIISMSDGEGAETPLVTGEIDIFMMMVATASSTPVPASGKGLKIVGAKFRRVDTIEIPTKGEIETDD